MYVGIEGAVKIAITVIILVFVILSLLALLMIGLREIIKLTSRKEDKKREISLSEKDKTIIKKPLNEESVQKNYRYNEELIAVISAALSNYIETPLKKIKIINISRSTSADSSPWVIAGKQSMMSNRISISSRKKGGF